MSPPLLMLSRRFAGPIVVIMFGILAITQLAETLAVAALAAIPLALLVQTRRV